MDTAMIGFILWAIYCMIASIAVAMTVREFVRSRRRQLRWACLGILSCLVWPVTVVAVAITAWRTNAIS